MQFVYKNKYVFGTILEHKFGTNYFKFNFLLEMNEEKWRNGGE